MSKFKIIFSITILSALFYFFIHNFTEWEELYYLFIEIKLGFLLLAFVFQISTYYFYLRVLSTAFGMYGIKWSGKDLMKNHFSSAGLSVITPFGMNAGISYYLKSAKQKNESLVKVMSGLYVSVVVSYLSQAVMVAISLVIMNYMGWIKSYQVITFMLLLGIIALVLIMLVIGKFSSKFVYSIFRLIQKIRNAFNAIFKKKHLVLEKWASWKTEEWDNLSEIFFEQKKTVVKAFAFSLISTMTSIMVFYMLFLGVGYNANFFQLFSGTGMVYLFTTITPTPLGIGIAEPLLATIFHTSGIDTAIATLVTFVYRGLSVWLPALLGFVIISRSQLKEIIKK